MKWKQAGTAVQGRRHFKKDIPCQDKYHLYSQDQFECISLADGAGSYKYSEIGAEITTQRICKYLEKYFDFIWESDVSLAKRGIIHSLRTSIGKEAQKRNCNLDDFSSTLLFVCVKNDKFICGHLGDGIIGILKDKNLIIISPPDTGEFANETYFITSVDYQTKFKLFKGKIENIEGFVIMSDGASNSFLDKANFVLAPILIDIFDWLKFYSPSKVSKALKKNFKNVIRLKTTDDCSIALMRKVNKK